MAAEPEKLDAPEGAQSLERKDIERRLLAAETALEAGLSEAAAVLAWSAVEAAIRGLISDEGIAITRPTTPTYLLQQAVFHGAISRDQYQHLDHLRKYRNAVVQGFQVDGFNENLAKDLLETAIELM